MKNKIAILVSASILLCSANTMAASKHHTNQHNVSNKKESKVKYTNKLPDVVSLVVISGIEYWVANNVYYKKDKGRYVIATPPVKSTKSNKSSKSTKASKSVKTKKSVKVAKYQSTYNSHSRAIAVYKPGQQYF